MRNFLCKLGVSHGGGPVNRFRSAIRIGLAMVSTLAGCTHRQTETIDHSYQLPIRECVRARMSAAGLRVSDVANVRSGELRPGRRLVGTSAPASGSLNQASGPVDVLTVWYSDSSFTT